VSLQLSAVGMGIPIWLFYFVFTSVFTSIGLAVVYFGIYPATPAADGKIATLASLDLGYAYLGAFVMKVGIVLLGINLGGARATAKVEVPDQQCYQVKGAEGSKLGYVLMETEGAIGEFNRAQRALQNFNENFPLFVVMYFLASFVFPFAAFVCTALFMAFRVMGAVGYTSAADGRLGGTMLAALTNAVVEGMVLLVGIKAVTA
jgi:uncharacterized membrane protein YecN with MAPEG domain